MATQRYLALDVMRGATLAMMILVNTPGDWGFVYAPLLHADWHGVTITDFVFPFFLFIIGSALFFSSRSSAQLAPAIKAKKIIKRTALLFIIGLLLHAFPFTTALSELRILGVLQRIALAYGIAAFIVWLPTTQRLMAALGILIAYWLVFILTDSSYHLADNIVRHIDIAILGAEHLWQGKGLAFDPEGLLSTLPAAVSILAGFEATRLLVSQPAGEPNNATSRQFKLALYAMCSITIALIWHRWMPINKSLWTSSFVLLTSGVGVLVLLLLVRLEPYRATAAIYRAFAIYGQNPLFIYVLSSLWVQCYFLFHIDGVNIYAWLNNQLNLIAEPYLASLIFALGHVIFFWGVAYVLHKKRIVVSV